MGLYKKKLFVRERPKKFWEHAGDVRMSSIDFEGSPPENNAYGSFSSHPRLPMPIRMWNMIPLRGKYVAYTSSLLMCLHISKTTKEYKGWVKVMLIIVVVIIVIVVTIYSYGTATSEAIAAGASATTATLAGISVAAAAASLTLNVSSMVASMMGYTDLARTFGTASQVASVVSIATGIGAGLSAGQSIGDIAKSSLQEMLKPSNLAFTTLNVGCTLWNMRIEDNMNKLMQQAMEAQKETDMLTKMAKENNPYLAQNGGVKKTYRDQAEDFEEVMGLVKQETLWFMNIMRADISLDSIYDPSKFNPNGKV